MSRSETEFQVEKLKESIRTGEMTIEELKDRLHLIIDTELLKDDEEVDIELIEACESFFTHLHGKEEPLSEEEYQEQWAKIQERVNTHGTKKRTFRKAPVYAAIAVAAIIILFFGISIKFQWFLPSSTPDGQQYIITGKQISIETISKAIASHNEFGQLHSNQREEIEAFLGYSIDGIVPEIEGWDSYNYHATFFPNAIYLKTDYRNQQMQDTMLRFTIRWYTDYTEVDFSLEQNEKGKYLQIGKQRVYRSENYDYITYTWVANSVVYTLSGVNVDTMIYTFLGEL